MSSYLYTLDSEQKSKFLETEKINIAKKNIEEACK